MRQKLSAQEVDLLVESFEEKALLRWFEKWSNSPWLYSFAMYLQKLPFYFIVLLLFDFKKLQTMAANPVAYLEQKGVLLIVGTIIFIVLYRIHWNQNAVKYYLHSKMNTAFTRVEHDHVIAKKGEKAKEKIPVRYKMWSNKKLFIQGVIALVLPVLFFSILYLTNGIKDGNWSLNKLITVFDSKETFIAVCAIFILSGLGLGYGLWRQVKDDYLLLNKAKAYL